jgi:copper transport protein
VRGTDYGRILVIKVALVALVAVLGGLSRSLVRARRRDVEGEVDVDELRHRLRTSVGIETIVGVGVLVVTSLLVAANPTAVAANEGFSAVKVVQGTQIEAALVPARTGPVTMHIYASDPTATLTTALDATATMSLPSQAITGITVPLRPAGHAHWTVDAFDVPIRGTWRLTVTVTIGEFTARTATFDITIN